MQHEIRHEWQLFHGLNSSKLRKRFPAIKKEYDDQKGLEEVKHILRKMYDSYKVERKKYGVRYMARELDAIIIEYMAFVEWRKNGSGAAVLDKVARIVRN